MTAPDIQAAASAISLAADVVAAAVGSARTRPDSEDQQVLLYDLAHAASAVEISRSLIDYGAKGDVEGRLACAFIADAIADLAAKLYGREALWAVEPGALDARPRLRRRLPRPRLRRRPGVRDRAVAPQRRLRDGGRHVPALRHRQDRTGRRAHPPRRHRHPRGDHRRPRRLGLLRAVGARGVRRVRQRQRERLPRHGDRHRGALPGLARRRRLADHPARDPHPRPRTGRHRGAEAGVAAPASQPARSWSPSP